MMKTRTRYALCCLTLLVVGSLVVGFTFSGNAPRTHVSAAPQAPVPEQPAQVKEIQGYRDWTKVNPQPVPIVSRQVSNLCSMQVNLKDNTIYDAESSPHANRLITVYVNELGRRAMLTELKPTFAVGSVIVKEKLSPQKQDEPELLTVMIKREPGFNPEVGDWEFMATNGAGTEVGMRGKLESCQVCHVPLKKTDFVSRVYLPKELRSKLR